MKSILVVEDEPGIRELLRVILEAERYRVLLAADVIAAMNLIRHEAPDMILLDVMLPGMNGLEICRRVRRDPQLRRIPIMILTARGSPSSQSQGLETGADDYVIKPFEPEFVKRRVATLFMRTAQNA